MYRILICDDQKDIVNALKIYLTPEGYDLYEAYDGQQAVEEGLIDQLGSVGEALHYLYQRIDGELPGPNEQKAPRKRNQ